MARDRVWRLALAEHDAVLAECRCVINDVPVHRWHVARAPGVWTPAEEAVHIRLAYAFGIDAVTTGAAMQLAVHPAAAWVAGHVLLPLLLRARRFPRGAAAPGEVMPSTHDAHATTPDRASADLGRAAANAVAALRKAEVQDPTARVVHAYFGALPPCQALRLLSAHTRHHAASLRRQHVMSVPVTGRRA